MEYFRFTDGLPDHGQEISELRRRAFSSQLSPLETAAVLASTDLLRCHEEGSFEICRSSYCLTLVALCLGRPFEAMHNEFGTTRRIILPDSLGGDHRSR